jgi:hypothetical protein
MAVPQDDDWVAMTLDRSRVVASASTFEALKAAAAKAGERSVLVAKPGRRRRFLYMFAVFIALGQPLAAGSADSAALDASIGTAETTKR